MIQAFHRASQLAWRKVKPTHACTVDLRPQLLPSISSVRCFSSLRPITFPTFTERKALKVRSTTLQIVRKCSQRRAMCKAQAETEGSVDVSKGREVLPANVKPLHYDLTLEPDFENFSYEGTVVIE